MTVTYTAKVATVKFKTLWKLLKRWKGSVYKNVWKDAALFTGLYFSLSLLYRVVLKDNQRRIFEKVVLYCNEKSSSIPVAFVLGFYVTVILNRWWEQINNVMPWPDNFAIAVTAFVHGNDDRGRLMRRTLLRYLNLSWILTLCSISTVAKKRFPTLDHLVEIGMMTKNEQEIFEKLKTPSNKYFVPLVWATTLLSRAKKEDRIHTEYAKAELVRLITRFRGGLGTLFNYDWLSVPLTYTQVVTIAVQAYFFAQIVGAQFLDPAQGYKGKEVDIYVPVFLFLEFLFYMGWLKVAESLLNPFGEDDDDFDTNWVLDRNIQVSYLIVDDMHSEYPELIKDAYWDSVDFTLPYTAAAEVFKVEPYLGSTNDIELSETEAAFVPMPPIGEENESQKGSVNQSITSGGLNRTVKNSFAKFFSTLIPQRSPAQDQQFTEVFSIKEEEINSHRSLNFPELHSARSSHVSVKTASQKNGASNQDIETRYGRETMNDEEFLEYNNIEKISQNINFEHPRSKSPENRGNVTNRVENDDEANNGDSLNVDI